MRVVPGPTYPSPPPLVEDPPLRDVEDPPERLEEDDEDGRRESVGVDGMGGGDTRLSPLLPPDPEDVEPPPDDPPDEPDEDDPPVRGMAV